MSNAIGAAMRSGNTAAVYRTMGCLQGYNWEAIYATKMAAMTVQNAACIARYHRNASVDARTMSTAATSCRVGTPMNQAAAPTGIAERSPYRRKRMAIQPHQMICENK